MNDAPEWKLSVCGAGGNLWIFEMVEIILGFGCNYVGEYALMLCFSCGKSKRTKNKEPKSEDVYYSKHVRNWFNDVGVLEMLFQTKIEFKKIM